jgi:hypothetical protein
MRPLRLVRLGNCGVLRPGAVLKVGNCGVAVRGVVGKNEFCPFTALLYGLPYFTPLPFTFTITITICETLGGLFHLPFASRLLPPYFDEGDSCLH